MAEQLAVGVEAEIGSPAHPAIGVPPSSKVTVPDGDPVAAAEIAATRLTVWLVTADAGVTASSVRLGLICDSTT